VSEDFECEWGSRDWFAHLYAKQGVENPAAYFGHQSSGYQKFRHKGICEVLGHGGIKKGSRVLDLGCGTGELTARIAEKVEAQDCLGIDFVKEAVDRARVRYPDLRFEASDLLKAQQPAGSWDLVVASEVFYYLAPDIRKRWQDEIEGLLKPGGVMLFASVLGQGYFTRAEARGFVEEGMEVEIERVEHHWLYHKITSPLMKVCLFKMYWEEGSEPGLKGSKEKFRRAARWMSVPGMSKLLGLAGWLSGLILRSEKLPQMCSWLNGGLFPLTGCETNIVILGRKPAAAPA
tara:strand:- start:8 stop:877 length:870 start_codon:yes stop_codon:yes gene_type:complete